MTKILLSKRKNACRQIAVTLLLVLSIINKGFAGIDPPVIQALDGSLGQVALNATVMVEDAKFFDAAYYGKLVKPYALQNVLSLEINEHTHIVIQSDFTVTVRLAISFVRNDSTTGYEERNFQVKYFANNVYPHKDVYIFKNCARVSAQIISLSKDVPWNAYAVVNVVNQLQSRPNYNYDCDLNAVQEINDSAWAANTTKDELPVYWPPSIGADEYDLEWTYIDSIALASGLYGDPGDPDANLIFDNNSSRVTIAGTFYTIPLIYDNSGYLFFRVRTVQWQPGGGRNEANWSSDYTNGLGMFYYRGHERLLNWQATTTYAEDGKRKIVVQYFDGSLRGRQTVTKDNSTNTTVVAESFYDYQGRPVIQVLPAPTINTIIKYSPGFNVGLNGNIYDKFNYDTLASPADFCSTAAAPMDTLSGAARYYSPNNELVDSSFNKYIPNSFGFPFTEVQYTQDNTGRISSQSGVGDKFRINGGHATQYMYATADQRQLDALFGTEVGDASHYFKTLVRDANGQYSVSYTDMHGRTVATALAGVPPDSIMLDTLDSYNTKYITQKLSDPASVVIRDLVMEHKSSIAVTKEDDYVFTYKLDPDSLGIEDCDSVQICYECLYDLEITITDDCNNCKLDGNVPFVTVIRNFQIDSINTSCNGPGFDTSFAIRLKEGSYEVTKKLTVSRYGMDYYRDSFFLAANTCKNLDSFLNEQRQLYADVLCQPTCATCKDSLGTWNEFWERYVRNTGIDSADFAANETMARTAYDLAIEDCNALCDSLNSDVKDIRRNMLMDMTPSSGQYANLDNEDDQYSIFFPKPFGADTLAVYQLVNNYVDENGNPELVYDESAGKLVSPNRLSREAFVQKFKSSWANALLEHHPENCKLGQYELLKNSHEWDRRFEAVESWQEAKAKGYLNPTNRNDGVFTHFAGTTLDLDPMPLYTYAGGLWEGMLEDSLENFRFKGGSPTHLSMWTAATMAVMCPNGSDSCYAKFYDPTKTFSYEYMCDGELDMAWRAFRQMYLDVKKHIQNQWLNAQCPTFPTATALMNAGHQPNFFDAREMLPLTDLNLSVDTATMADQYQQLIDAQYDSTCKNYAVMWYKQLAPCNLKLTEDSAYIISNLINICREGSDYNHPYGSSSIAPSSTHEWESFEQFIKQYCIDSNVNYAICNSYLITAPKPYNYQTANSNKPVYSKPEDCECYAINNYYTQYQASSGFSSFSAYMEKVHNTIISTDHLNALMALCDIGEENPDCPVLSTPIYLPPAFQCFVGDVCTSCEDFAALHDEFKVLFPDIHPAAVDTFVTDSAHIRANDLYERFMNYRLGYNKTVDEYMDFGVRCGAFVDTSHYLPTLIRNFKDALIGTPTYVYGSIQDHDQFMVNGYLTHPNTLDTTLTYVAQGFLHNKLCFPEGFEFEIRLKNESANFFVMSVHDNGDTATSGGFYVQFSSPSSVTINSPYVQDSKSRALSAPATSLPGNMFDWHIYKCRVTTTHYEIYVDGQFLQSYTKMPDRYGLPVGSIAGFYFNLVPPDVYLDWVKISDHNGVVKYLEEFNNPDTLSKPAWDAKCPSANCTTLFTNYFNQHQQTSYTYNQIDSLYSANNVLFNPCESDSSNLSLCGRAEPVFARSAMDEVNNCSDSTFFIQSKAQELYKVYIDSLKNQFDSAYLAKCMAAYKMEQFTVYHKVNEFHHTLYYYDQAGNLIKTVPPAGVRANYDSLWLDSVYDARLANQVKRPDHVLVTQYRYNTLNQAVAQKSPDGGMTEFWYDRLGRLTLSRNAKQVANSSSNNHLFSFTRYDQLGRITQVGQLREAVGSSVVDDALTRKDSALQAWFNTYENYRHQLTTTVYDETYFTGAYDPLTVYQRNLRNRVSYVSYSDTTGLAVAFNNAVFYTYDAAGNVDTLLQDYGCGSCGVSSVYNMMNRNGNRWKKIVYNYDLISGKVNTVAFQRGYADQFFQRYIYDAENRLILAESSRDSVVWEREAKYEYYKHGPLARMVLGHQQVQGIDYAYTLQGWLKGMNSTGGSITHDMGGDGASGGANQYTARDAIGLSLNYFVREYNPINQTVNPFPGYRAFLDSYRPLFNGNISSSSVFNRKLTGQLGGDMLFYNYRYDQLNRITGMDVYNGFSIASNNWNAMLAATVNTVDSVMREKVAYDANGNILSYRRNHAGGLLMDNLQYKYYPGTNQLRQVTDGVTNDAQFGGDIDHQADTSNYVYDAIGNLVQDKKEDITSIKWNVYGKITAITRNSTGTVPVTNIKYVYDALGNRIGKVFDLAGQTRYTWYVRDAQGNVLSIYDANFTGTHTVDTLFVIQSEQYLYGSSRLGFLANAQGVENGPASMQFYNGGQFFRGKRQYELSNHLGNVLVVLSDKKFGVSSGGSLNDYYNPDMLAGNDYYPFGMVARIASQSIPYTRFGFNGKEFDWEAKGWMNQYDYGARIYDPRIGKFLSVDPLTKSYAMLTPYQFASNRPIDGIDLDGLEHVSNVYQMNFKTGKAELQKVNINYEQAHWSENNILIIGTRSYDIGKQNPHEAAKAYKKAEFPESGTWKGRYTDYSVDSYDGRWWVDYKYSRAEQYYEDQVLGDAIIEGINTFGLIIAPLQSLADETAMMSKGRPTNTAGITSEISTLSKVEQQVINEANNILNSKQFQVIKKAFEAGEEATVTVGGRTIHYSPDAPEAGMTLFQFGKGEFIIGPGAFKKSSSEVGKTILHELYRLYTQGGKAAKEPKGVGNIGNVDKETRKWADDAAKHLKTNN